MRKLFAALCAAALFALVLPAREAAARGSCGAECARAVADAVVFVARETTTVDVDGRAAWYSAPPPVSYDAPYGPNHVAPPGVGMTGMSVDFIHVTDDHVILPMIGFGVAFPFTGWDGMTAADGTGSFHFDTRLAFALLLPGVGYRVEEGRWAFSATMRMAVVDLYTSGRFETVDATTPFESNAFGFAVRADFSACDRFDDDARVCAFIAPNAYEYTWANGGSVGLRLELGK
jgi:hypothetical protein